MSDNPAKILSALQERVETLEESTKRLRSLEARARRQSDELDELKAKLAELQKAAAES